MDGAVLDVAVGATCVGDDVGTGDCVGGMSVGRGVAVAVSRTGVAVGDCPGVALGRGVDVAGPGVLVARGVRVGPGDDVAVAVGVGVGVAVLTG